MPPARDAVGDVARVRDDTCQAARRRPIKRVIYLNECGDRVIEAAVVLSAAPKDAEVTAGDVVLVLHPLRAL